MICKTKDENKKYYRKIKRKTKIRCKTNIKIKINFNFDFRTWPSNGIVLSDSWTISPSPNVEFTCL